MQNTNPKPEDARNKLSRRNLLRNSAIAATGTMLLPSFLTGCTKMQDILVDRIPGRGFGTTPLTPLQLQNAADNLVRMRAWYTDLYPLCIEYEEAVFKALGSTKENGNWTNFVVSVFIDVAIGLTGGAAIISGATAAMPAFACIYAILKDWGFGKDKPSNLSGEFAAFEFGHSQMQFAIEQKLSHLADPRDNYVNLRLEWQNEIKFNGNTYTIGDLASANFPGLGDEYNKLQAAAYTNFKQSLWNLVIMKCCSYYRNYSEVVSLPKVRGAFRKWAQEKFYPEHKGNYMRALWVGHTETSFIYDVYYWNLGINGYEFPEAAVNELFIDDVPGHVINPNGLFHRSYVFQQFSKTKPDFSVYYLGLGKVLTKELSSDSDDDFAYNSDWNFTGGMFPQLTQ